MPIRSVPTTASIAEAKNGKLFAPAAARNLKALQAELKKVAPQAGRALELASGTGQHVVGLAAAHPALLWTPSEVDPERLASIELYAAESGCDNIAPALELNATETGWSERHAGFDLVLLSNLLHLISDEEAQTLISEVQKALTAGGLFAVYGPFMRDGRLTSDGDRRFHASIQENDPTTGYKDTADMARWLAEAGLTPRDMIEMPANNLLILAEVG